MNRIEKMNTGSTWMMLAGGAIGAGAFSILFSGTWRDGICALLAGLILELYLCFLIPHTSFPKIMTNISGAFLMSTVCCILYRLGIGDHLDLMTIGPVFVMTPGVPITNAFVTLWKTTICLACHVFWTRFLSPALLPSAQEPPCNAGII